MRNISCYTHKELNELIASLQVSRAQVAEVISKYPPLTAKYRNSIYYQQFKTFKIEDFIKIEKDKMTYGWSFVNPTEKDNQEFNDFCDFIEFINKEVFLIFGITTFYEERVDRTFSHLAKAMCKGHLLLQNEYYLAYNRADVLKYVDDILLGLYFTHENFIRIRNDLTEIDIKAKQKHFTLITEEEAFDLLLAGKMSKCEDDKIFSPLRTGEFEDKVCWYNNIRPLLLAMENKIIEKMKNQTATSMISTNILASKKTRLDL